MTRQFHPLKIEMLLHYGMKNYKFESIEQAAAVRANHELFVEHGFLRMLPAPPYYAITAKGVEYIDRLCCAAFQIAKRLNNGNAVVKPARPPELADVLRDFEAYSMFDVEPYTTRYGAPNWGRSHVSFKVPLRFGNTGEKLKDFVAVAVTGEPRSHIQAARDSIKPVKPEWMTPEWEARYERWRKFFANRGMVGAFHRRLMDMMFAKTDKLRDVEMCKIISGRIAQRGPHAPYGALRRDILDAERPK